MTKLTTSLKTNPYSSECAYGNNWCRKKWENLLTTWIIKQQVFHRRENERHRKGCGERKRGKSTLMVRKLRNGSTLLAQINTFQTVNSQKTSYVPCLGSSAIYRHNKCFHKNVLLLYWYSPSASTSLSQLIWLNLIKD